MKFSVVMPSYLGWYKSAAKNREWKIVRAINSVIEQSYKDWELVVVADGCKRTVEIVREVEDERVKLYYIPKQRTWSGLVRNTGISKAKGDWIVYLDIDDMFGPEHLEIISRYIENDVDWIWFNNWSWDKGNEEFREYHAQLIRAKCGTCNFAHRRERDGILLVGWRANDNYLHDWRFVLNLMQVSGKFGKIETPEYLVCHVPSLLDYDGDSKKIRR